LISARLSTIKISFIVLFFILIFNIRFNIGVVDQRSFSHYLLFALTLLFTFFSVRHLLGLIKNKRSFIALSIIFTFSILIFIQSLLSGVVNIFINKFLFHSLPYLTLGFIFSNVAIINRKKLKLLIYGPLLFFTMSLVFGFLNGRMELRDVNSILIFTDRVVSYQGTSSIFLIHAIFSVYVKNKSLLFFKSCIEKDLIIMLGFYFVFSAIIGSKKEPFIFLLLIAYLIFTKKPILALIIILPISTLHYFFPVDFVFINQLTDSFLSRLSLVMDYFGHLNWAQFLIGSPGIFNTSDYIHGSLLSILQGFGVFSFLLFLLLFIMLFNVRIDSLYNFVLLIIWLVSIVATPFNYEVLWFIIGLSIRKHTIHF
jgi:hypothetical protein